MSYEVKVFKLVSGEEVIGKVEELDFGKWLVSDARTLGINHQSGTAGWMPFMMSHPEATVTIKTDHVLAVAKSVPSDMEKKYLADTSGIALAQ